MPTLRFEKELWSQGLLRVVGVDEVGMAALAGPVVAAACLVTPDTKLIRRVRDSKVLTRPQREDLFELIQSRVVRVGIGAASVSEIHRLNIYHASHVAMTRALRQIGEYDWVLVDGRRILDPAFAPGRHNCGYPTIDNRTALRARGLTPLHRHDFGTVKLLRAVENQLELALAGE